LSSSIGCAHDPLEAPGGDARNPSPADDDSSAQVVDAASMTSDASTALARDAAAKTVDSGGDHSARQDAGARVEAGSGSSDMPDAAGPHSQVEAGTDRGRDAGAFPPLAANVTLHVAGDSTSAIFPASDPTQWDDALTRLKAAVERED
jgi:hypothetical protein